LEHYLPEEYPGSQCPLSGETLNLNQPHIIH
jgi:hypothetical protein